jgi:hypothetical protein
MNRKSLMWILPVLFVNFFVGGCTSDPYAPINQTTPIRQMDNAFDPSGSRFYGHPAPPPAYQSQGGYQMPSARY